MLSRIENEHDFLNRIIFSDEATFHVSNKLDIITTAEFGAQKIPMQYRKWKETVKKSMCGLLFHMTQSKYHFAFLRLLSRQKVSGYAANLRNTPNADKYLPTRC
ncbi:hypothetical protein AVEN_95025-1 [Araneus ventricosus]|uniref:Uncharacterized protein n=1 Tax=Araneus ventricosus TaxID=182803 RepID=A0A4Y2WJ48_ARAVE|nr:hypothetical protein AVEN_95025-1 [Araneus ventricosus]